MKKIGKFKGIISKILILATFLGVIFFVWNSNYYKKKQNEIVLKTQYTFCVRIDKDGNVLEDDENIGAAEEAKTETETGFGNLSLEEISKIWITKFTSQFEQKYVPRTKSLENVEISKTAVLNQTQNIVLVAFTGEPQSNNNDYFSSWEGYMSEGKMVCEWVIQFEIEDLYDNTARIYAKSIQVPASYGQATSKEKETQTEKATEDANKPSESNLYTYKIEGGKLSVTYDGGEKWTAVPVDFSELLPDKNEQNILTQGSYKVGLEKTAFLYGGYEVSGQAVPLTVIYSDDKGANWTSAVVSDAVGVIYSYVNFFNAKDGVIVVGYDKLVNQEESMILKTSDGGESWTRVGQGPVNNIISGVNFIDANTGYIGYEYVDGMESNLYVTTNGGTNFTPVILENQKFEDENTTFVWKSVYKDLKVPTLDSESVLTLMVTQGKNGTYNGGDTVAKFQSNDFGATWQYKGEE